MPGRMSPQDAAQLIVRSLGARSDNGVSLVGIDGRSGSGKTSLTELVLAALRMRGAATECVHLDDLYAGWDGLAEALPVLREQVLRPLRAGQPGAYRPYDWQHGRFAAERVLVRPHPVVVVEGVGAVHADPGAYDLTIWLAAPEAVRRRRALGRDGETFAPHWQGWAQQEDELFGEGPGLPSGEPHLVLELHTPATSVGRG